MPSPTRPARYFGPETLTFLTQLARNNRKEWFEKNRGRYDEHVKGPALRFIEDFAKPLEQISPSFLAIAKPVGGSLFRIHRDVRFAKDKSPYKTHVGIHFRHFGSAETPHCPGWYLHIEPGASFCGVGIWQPDAEGLQTIRQAIVDDPSGWKKATRGVELEGESLARPPRGFDPRHPLLVDLKRKDFIASARLTDAQIASPAVLKTFEARCKAYRPFMKWLTEAVRLPF